VYFNGLGRAIVTNDMLKGPVLDNDVLTPRKATGGYTLFDLGINAQPDSTIRASVILRVRNEFGGFYGDGASLRFRQLRLDGIIAKAIKYDIGDIDVQLSPYTVFNFDESYHKYEAGIFAQRRSIVHYENFNFGNKWRVQGVQGASDLKFKSFIENLHIKAFASRIKNADFLTSSYPDRLLMGGRLEVKQSQFLKVGGNFSRTVDVEFAPNPNLTFLNSDNKVGTGDARIDLGNETFSFSIFGEAGASVTSLDRNFDNFSRKTNGSFYDAGLSAGHKPLGIKSFLSYKSVSENFHSPAAQTRRIYDRGVPSIFPDYRPNGNLTSRTPSLLDRYGDEELVRNQRLRNVTIFDTLMVFDPRFNNISPYGAATPNRQGLSVGAEFGGTEKLLSADVKADFLKELAGTDSTGTRNFTGISGGVSLNVHQLLDWNKSIVFSIGGRNERTSRTSDTSRSIGLSSTLADIGLTVEFIKDFDLLL
jgi:hypothetical protein